MKHARKSRLRQTPQYLLIGAITAAPLWVTWLVFDLMLTQLSRLGSPWIGALSVALGQVSPALGAAVLDPRLQSFVAALLSLLMLYLLGWAVSLVIGRRILQAFEGLLERIPLVKAVYGGTRRFLSVVKERPEGVQRVVLIPFPSREMRTIGFVTRVIDEQETGRKLAAVYVPTAPNPTSGYMELVPVEVCVQTDWSVDEAMSFILTGGTTAPPTVRFGEPPFAAPFERPERADERAHEAATEPAPAGERTGSG